MVSTRCCVISVKRACFVRQGRQFDALRFINTAQEVPKLTTATTADPAMDQDSNISTCEPAASSSQNESHDYSIRSMARLTSYLPEAVKATLLTESDGAGLPYKSLVVRLSPVYNCANENENAMQKEKKFFKWRAYDPAPLQFVVLRQQTTETFWHSNMTQSW